MNVKGLRNASRIEMPRLGCEHQYTELRQSHALSDSRNGFGRNGSENSRRAQKGIQVLSGRPTPSCGAHGATSKPISCLRATISER
jgi:hypothetical protein